MELRKEGSVAELATLIALGLVLVRPLIGERKRKRWRPPSWLSIALEPSHRGVGGMASGGKAALDQVATGWRLPVDHLARDEDAGKLIDHEAVAEFAPSHAAGRRDRFRQGTGPKKFEGTGFDCSGENLGRIPRSKMGEMPEHGGGRGIQIQSPPSFAHVVGRDPAQLFLTSSRPKEGFRSRVTVTAGFSRVRRIGPR